MKQIRLTGRERAVLRGLDNASGSTGEELLEFSRLAPDDLLAVLNSMLSGCGDALNTRLRKPAVLLRTLT